MKELTNSNRNNKITLGISMDLAKAFETVNHNILLSKLYGVRDITYKWFRSEATGFIMPMSIM